MSEDKDKNKKQNENLALFSQNGGFQSTQFPIIPGVGFGGIFAIFFALFANNFEWGTGASEENKPSPNNNTPDPILPHTLATTSPFTIQQYSSDDQRNAFRANAKSMTSGTKIPDKAWDNALKSAAKIAQNPSNPDNGLSMGQIYVKCLQQEADLESAGLAPAGMATYIDDLLGFARNAETKGFKSAKYDIVNGGENRRFTQKTIAQVLKTPMGKDSTAAGAYQIVNGTLNDCITATGVDVNKKFTPKTQDLMATRLLLYRGLDDFIQGDMSQTKFHEGLAKEWASIRRPGMLAGAYDGYNNNIAYANATSTIDNIGIVYS